MNQLDLADHHLNRLRQWRNRPDPDLTLSDLAKQFDREVRRPYQQLSSIAQIWYSLLPKTLAEHTLLESLHRGVLRVSVDSSPRLFELDRLLRSGLERQLTSLHRSPGRFRVQLRLVSRLPSDQ